jgi:hypothetical protein
VDAGPDKHIPFGTSTTLAGVVSGGTGLPVYSWTPYDSIFAGWATLTPLTKNRYASSYFKLTVTDGKLCTNRDSMQVILDGNPLDVSVTASPATICFGDSVQLSATGSGGSGTYTYSWVSFPNTPPWSSALQNPRVSPDVSKRYRVTVNDGFNTDTASVYVTVLPLPIAYQVTGGGSYCLGGTGVLIGLDNSETDVTYQLFRGTTGLSMVPGTGSSISFGYHTIEGAYTIKATSTVTPCQNLMSGSATVTILQLPIPYTVTGGGSYPAGGTGVPVGLSNSDIGIDYQLFLDGIPINPVNIVPGTGNPISFGNQTAAGNYTVVATNSLTGCSIQMNGSVNVVINPWPAYFRVFGGGPICQGAPGKMVSLDGSEFGVRYILRRNADSIAGVPGTGDTIHFGTFTLAGLYTVKGINISTGLSRMMKDSAVIVVNPLPITFMLIPQGDTCYGTEVLLNGSQAGVNYYLIRGNDTISMVAGTGLFGLLSFGHIYDTGTFRAVGINALTGCSNDMLGTVTLLPAPLLFDVIPPGILCPGETVLLSGSQIGIMYQLRRDSLINVGPPVAGTGLMLSFGPQYLPGKYRVIAYNPLTHCYSWMNGDATIQISPTVFNILPAGDTCALADDLELVRVLLAGEAIEIIGSPWVLWYLVR